jgi:hypothetical protein
MGKNQDPDPASGTRMTWFKILKFFDADAGIFLTLDPG